MAKKFCILACFTRTSPLYIKSKRLSMSSKVTSHKTITGLGAGLFRNSFRKKKEHALRINLWARSCRPSMASVTSKKSSSCRISDMVAMTLSWKIENLSNLYCKQSEKTRQMEKVFVLILSPCWLTNFSLNFFPKKRECKQTRKTRQSTRIWQFVPIPRWFDEFFSH